MKLTKRVGTFVDTNLVSHILSSDPGLGRPLPTHGGHSPPECQEALEALELIEKVFLLIASSPARREKSTATPISARWCHSLSPFQRRTTSEALRHA
jgi:hypothetical protein